MSKFHINKHGVPAPCRATKGNCPLGGDSGNENHYNTEAEAQAGADMKHEASHGLIHKIEPADSTNSFKTEDGEVVREGDYVYMHDDDDEKEVFYDDGVAYDSIVEQNYPGEVHGSGHADDIRGGLREIKVTKEMIEERNTEVSRHQGNRYSISNHNFNSELSESNVNDVLNKGFEDGDVKISYEAESFNNTPVEFNATVSSLGNNEYDVKGQISEYSMIEDDFESSEEFEDYLSEGPDTTYDTNYKLSGEELKENLVRNSSFVDNSPGVYPDDMSERDIERRESSRKYDAEIQTPGIMVSGIYEVSRDNME